MKITENVFTLLGIAICTFIFSMGTIGGGLAAPEPPPVERVERVAAARISPEVLSRNFDRPSINEPVRVVKLPVGPKVVGEMYTTTTLRYRAVPDGEIFGVSEFATLVQITDRTRGEWQLVVYGDGYAWMHSDYLSVTKPEPPPPPEPPPAPEPEPEPAPEPEPEPEPQQTVAVPAGVWDKLAECESGGNWSINTGNGYYGGLQFSLGTWQAYGGSGYPHENSREEQIRIAEKVRDARGGYGDWPACSSKLGLPK